MSTDQTVTTSNRILLLLSAIFLGVFSLGCASNDIIRIDKLDGTLSSGVPSEQYRETVIKVAPDGFFTVIPIALGATWGPVEIRRRDASGRLQSRHLVEQKHEVGSLYTSGCLDYSPDDGLLYYFGRTNHEFFVYDTKTQVSKILLETGEEKHDRSSRNVRRPVLPQKVRILGNRDLLAIYEQRLVEDGKDEQFYGFVTVLSPSGVKLLDKSASVVDYAVHAPTGRVLIKTWPAPSGEIISTLDCIGGDDAKRQLAQFPRMTSVDMAFSENGDKVYLLCDGVNDRTMELQVYDYMGGIIKKIDLGYLKRSPKTMVTDLIDEGKGRVGFLIRNDGLTSVSTWYNLNINTGACVVAFRGEIAPAGVMRDADALVSDNY